MIRNQSGQIAGGQVINATTGAGFSGTVTTYVTIDGGVQAIGTVGSGLATHEGNGYYTYPPSAAETNGQSVAFTFIGTGAIPASTTYDTLTAAQAAAIQATSTTLVTSGQQLAEDAFALLNVYMPGDELSAADGHYALRALNGLMGSLAQQSFTIPSRSRNVFDVVANQGSYTIGLGGDFDMVRPSNQKSITGASLLMTTSSPAVEVPCAILTDDGYDSIQIKDLTCSQWTCVYYNPTFTTGFGTINLWPIPDTSVYDLVLYVEEAVPSFATLATTYNLPPGYSEALVYQLAKRLSTPYGRSLSAEAREIGAYAMQVIKRSNVKVSDMPNDLGWLGNYRPLYNIQTGSGG